MPTWPSRVVVTVLLLPAFLAAGGAQESSSQQQPPTFRTGVRLVEVDVVVRDKNDQFVDTLTKDDFEVLEDGAPRQIQQLWTVNLSPDRRNPLSPVTSTPSALLGSEKEVGRLYVLVLGNGQRDDVRRIARQFITDALGPTDLMSVVHVNNRAATQGLTSNRELLLAAADRYQGGGTDEALLAMLKSVVVSLNASTGRRKAVLFIGKGFNLWSPPAPTGDADTGYRVSPTNVDSGVAALKLSRVFEDVTRTAKRNNVRIYPIDPDGFTVAPSTPHGILTNDTVASFRIMAADTDGIAIANTNNYAGNFKKIVRDNSWYYLLTYDSQAEADGRPHPITVRLRNRSTLSLEQGRLSVTASAPDVRGRGVRFPKGLSPEVRNALASSTAIEDTAVEVFTAVYQGSNFDGSVLIGTHVPGALLRLAPKEDVELAYMAVDRWGVVRATERRVFTLNLSPQRRRQVEQTGLRLFGRLQVPHGQYQIRVVAHQPNGITAGASTTVDVPDFADQPLTVSEFVVASTRAGNLLTLEEDAVLRGALPAQPTPSRRFARSETPMVFAEIYDSHWAVSQEVGVTMSVSAHDGRQVFRREQVLTTADKGRFYVTVALPLDTFAPGDYQLLLEVHARHGIPANTSRQMPFAVFDEDGFGVTTGSEAMNNAHTLAVTAGALCLAVVMGAAQDAREFELVSVRRVPPPAAGGVGFPVASGEFRVLPNGRFEARRQSLVSLAQVAYGFDQFDRKQGVVQASGWVMTERFDITAATDQPWSTPPTATSIPAELRTMLRALLEDRFALQTRIETKDVDVIAMRLVTPGTTGTGLRPSSAECRGPLTDPSPGEAAPRPRCPYEFLGFELQAQSVTMPEVTQLLSLTPYFKTELLVDETGLPGRYDVSLLLPNHGKRMIPTQYLKEFEKQLGVSMKRATLRLRTLVIEKAKMPQEN